MILLLLLLLLLPLLLASIEDTGPLLSPDNAFISKSGSGCVTDVSLLEYILGAIDLCLFVPLRSSY
jgi:hypothetical protein